MSDQYTAPYDAAPEPPAAAVARPEKNWWGFAALITGLVALLGAAIPVLNYGVWIVALVGIALGIVSLVVKHRRRGAGIAGLVLSIVALILSIVLAIVYTVLGVRWIDQYLDDSGVGSGSSDPSGRSVEVVYEVIGDGGTADIQYVDFDDDGSSEVQTELDERLPFEESTELDAAAVSGARNATVSAIAGGDSSTISCRVIIDGTVADQQTDTGPNAEVTCSTGN